MTGVDCEALRAIKFLRDQCGFCCGDPDSEISRAWKAIEAKSAAYDALVARVEAAPVVTAGSWIWNYMATAQRIKRGTRVRLLVSDDRPSHTAGDGNG